MKSKKIYLIALCIVLAGQVFAERTTFKTQSENWLQNSSEGLRSSPPTVDEDTGEMKDSPTVPVGNAVWLLVGLGLTYGLYLRKVDAKRG